MKKSKNTIYWSSRTRSCCNKLSKSLNKKNCIVIDDTKEKQNKLFPGTHIPVTQWEKVDFDNYDIAIILSWNYSDYLLDKLTSYGFKKDVYTLIPDIKKYREENTINWFVRIYRI